MNLPANNYEQLHIDGTSVLHRAASDAESPLGSLILLHGYGADEYDLMGLSSYFHENIQILSIRGGGETPFGGASWFDIDMLADGSMRFNIDQAQKSTQSVIDILSRLKELGIIPSKQVILAGFSQGATIANLVSFRHPGLLRGLLIMSGRLPEHVEQFAGDQSKYAGLSVFAGHGLHDNIIPVAYGRQIVSFWDSISDLEHHEYPMGHEISQAELVDIQGWLDRILSRK